MEKNQKIKKPEKARKTGEVGTAGAAVGAKKQCVATVLTLILAVLFTSCGGSPQANIDLHKVYKKINQTKLLPKMTTADENMLENNYAIPRSDCTQMIVKVCTNTRRADEIVLIEAKDGKENEIIQKLNIWLANKAQYASEYSPEQYAVIKKCSVYANGKYVRMIVSPDAQALINVFNSFF